jgi:hypothetical protein
MRKTPDPSLELTRMERGVVFYHSNDERTFFEWLGRIPCVERFEGEGERGLVVYLKRRPRKDELREILAICQRYGVAMRQLAKFETAGNRAWFRDPRKYWYAAVFGKSGMRAGAGDKARTRPQAARMVARKPSTSVRMRSD